VGISVQSRQRSMTEFNSHPLKAVMVISMMAGGVGLNLTAASSVFICDPWWNGAIEDQCIGRCHRIGQTNPVRVLKFVVQSSVEVGISKIQDNKRMLSKDVLMADGGGADGEDDGEEKSGPGLTIDDFKLLFSSIRVGGNSSGNSSG